MLCQVPEENQQSVHEWRYLLRFHNSVDDAGELSLSQPISVSFWKQTHTKRSIWLLPSDKMYSIFTNGDIWEFNAMFKTFLFEKPHKYGLNFFPSGVLSHSVFFFFQILTDMKSFTPTFNLHFRCLCYFLFICLFACLFLYLFIYCGKANIPGLISVCFLCLYFLYFSTPVFSC